MELSRAELAPERLASLIERFPDCRIAILGDFFLDKYIEVDPQLEELSLETGKPAHQVVNVRHSPGAAGTVTGNLAALGAGTLHAVGFTGEDGEGFDLRSGLTALDVSQTHLHSAADRRTPTYLKPRPIDSRELGAEHSRYDTKNRVETDPAMVEKIIRSLDALLSEVDAVVVMDQVDEQDCGVVTAPVREALRVRALAANSGPIFWADSRRNIHEFRGVIIKPNQFEAAGESNVVPQTDLGLAVLVRTTQRIRARNGAPVVVTRGAAGMLVTDPQLTLVPGIRVDGEIDPTGAGDSATAGAVLALCAGATLPEAALVGNLVASITVQQVGTTGVARPEELPPRLELWREQNQR